MQWLKLRISQQEALPSPSIQKWELAKECLIFGLVYRNGYPVRSDEIAREQVLSQSQISIQFSPWVDGMV